MIPSFKQQSEESSVHGPAPPLCFFLLFRFPFCFGCFLFCVLLFFAPPPRLLLLPDARSPASTEAEAPVAAPRTGAPEAPVAAPRRGTPEAGGAGGAAGAAAGRRGTTRRRSNILLMLSHTLFFLSTCLSIADSIPEATPKKLFFNALGVREIA